ncbi:glycosyltransferase [bacterium]|nr:glycosyltransferase [bacterium]MCB9479642.1 glycosyltransferase [Deltaproteobacteria bacterium]
MTIVLMALALAAMVASGLGILYPYVGYPRMLRSAKRVFKSGERQDGPAPKISAIVAAYNEERVMAAKLDNLLEQEYAGEIEVIVASDASEDETDAIVKRYAEKGVRLHRRPERRGKSMAQNAAVELATGDVLVFTDASVLLRPGAIAALMEQMRDPTVGAVTGEDVSTAADDQDQSAGAGFYTRLEIKIRRREAENTGTLIGVSGCLFAVRKELRPPVPADSVDDLYVPLYVVSQGYRVVAAEDAKAIVRRTANLDAEFARKVRTFTGALFTMRAIRKKVGRGGLAKVKTHLRWHKKMRWYGPFFALLALVSNGVLVALHPAFAYLMMLQMVVYVLGLTGVAAAVSDAEIERRALISGKEPKKRRRGPIRKMQKFASFFLLVEAALVVAWLRYIFRKPFATWTPTKRAEG